MKRTQPCHVCIDLLTIDKDFIFDEDSQPEFRLLQLTDRGGLKYPSEFIRFFEVQKCQNVMMSIYFKKKGSLTYFQSVKIRRNARLILNKTDLLFKGTLYIYKKGDLWM